MGARVDLTFYCRDEATATQAAEAAFGRMADIEAALSDWQVDSEVARLREQPAGEAVPISPDLDATLAQALEVSRASQGVFDVSCGALTRLWREARDQGRVPAAAAIEEARRSCGWEGLQRGHDEHGPVLLIEHAGVELDFGGIGKGYAADAALEVLDARGIHQALVDFGGDIAVGDAPPGTRGWRISAPGRESPLVLANHGVATSGATEQFIQVGDRRLSHLLDPRTGEAVVDHGQFTVIAPTAARADAWASVAAVVGVERAESLLPAGSGVRFLPPAVEPTAKP